MQAEDTTTLEQPSGKSIESVTLYAAHMALRMCRVLRWATPIVIGIAAWMLVAMVLGVGVPETWNWDTLPMTLDTWGLMFICAIAYSSWCSRLMTDIISSIEGTVETDAKDLLCRHLIGTVLLSSAFLTNNPRASDIVYFTIPVGIVILSSIPVTLTYLKGMRRRNPSCPTWRIVLTGVGLTLGTLLLTILLGCLVCAVIMAILSVIAASVSPLFERILEALYGTSISNNPNEIDSWVTKIRAWSFYVPRFAETIALTAAGIELIRQMSKNAKVRRKAGEEEGAERGEDIVPGDEPEGETIPEE